MIKLPEPITREETFLAAAAGESVSLPTPVTREEMFLAKLAGEDVETPTPITRKEMFLEAAAQGGGGGGVTVEPLSATANGTYTAPSGKAYSPVTVDVPVGEQVYVSPTNGMLYTPNMVIPATATSFRNDMLKGATELVSLEANALVSSYQFSGALAGCSKLKSVSWPRQQSYAGGNTNTFIYCPALESIQLGGIGYPVTSIDFTTSLSHPITITIYCTSIEAVTFSNCSPISANDTVIYRDSTTGEVITA